MDRRYNHRNCQSLFGYAQRVHERSGGVCQLCGCGAGSRVDFDLWRQMTVEHLIGESQGGYVRQVKRALARRFRGLGARDIEGMAMSIDEANTVTACSFCNSTTSRDKAAMSMEDLLNESDGTPNEVVSNIIGYLGEIHERKKRDVAWKLEFIGEAFEQQVEPTLLESRSETKQITH